MTYCSLVEPKSWLILSDVGVMIILRPGEILDSEYLHHLIAQVIDDLNCDATRLRFLERTRRIVVQCSPRISVDFRLESGPE